MILNRLASFKRFNYKYVVGEIVLIFIGISLSLYFEQWRANRANREKEKELLGQLMASVERDTAKLSNLIVVNDVINSRVSWLLDSGRFEAHPSERAIRSLAYINVYYTYSPDFSAYENIKHEGLTLISNQSLRLELIRYYDQMADQKAWTESVMDFHFVKQLTPYVIDSFVDYQREFEAVPEDFDALKNDKRFWKLVNRTKMFTYVTSIQMKDRLKLANNFRVKVKDELDHLQ